MSNLIDKSIELSAPVSRVWRALTDYKQFGTWFRVRLDEPFAARRMTSGNITHPGHEHLRFNARVERIEPEQLFSLTWHPYAIDPNEDYTKETPTLVEFTLEKSAKGTLLRVVESGFNHVPAARRAEAYRMNERGWATQLKNIEQYLTDAK